MSPGREHPPPLGEGRGEGLRAFPKLLGLVLWTLCAACAPTPPIPWSPERRMDTVVSGTGAPDDAAVVPPQAISLRLSRSAPKS